MKKRVFSALAIALVAVIAITTLVACNPYKWDSIGGGDATADVVSNGGYVVKQGNYIYYINGFVGADANNTWGTPVKNALVRAELNEDGTINNASTKVLAPKVIHSTAKNGGIAIFGGWVYYATPNSNKDKYGVASTTNMDFMRTRIDGSETQFITTINSRSANYIFTADRVLYFLNGKIDYVLYNDAKVGAEGTLVEDVAQVSWKYGTDSIYFVQNVTGTDSYKNYNKLVTIKMNGADEQVLATEDTYLADGQEAVDNPLNVFKFNLLDMYIESDGDVTLYYVKTHTLNGNAVTDGLFMAKASDIAGTEIMLNKNGTTAIFALGYQDGALALNGSVGYFWYNGSDPDKAVQVTDESKTVWAVDVEEGVAYYSATSSATALLKIAYKNAGNVSIVLNEAFKTDWFNLEFIGDDFYFFATNDENYLHTINVSTFDKDAEDAESTYVGFEREEDEDEADA